MKELKDFKNIVSVVESILFSSTVPQTLAQLKSTLKTYDVTGSDVKKAVEHLQKTYSSDERGIALASVQGGYQFRTQPKNREFLVKIPKTKTFRISGPALEALAIVAYNQPCIKAQVDEIRGVESGHLMRVLMEKRLIDFAGKSDLPGKPVMYKTTPLFLEVFSLDSLENLPPLKEVETMLPEGISEEDKPVLGDMTESLSKSVSKDEEIEGELTEITETIQSISTTTDFFTEEKAKAKELAKAEKEFAASTEETAVVSAKDAEDTAEETTDAEATPSKPEESLL